MGIFFIFGLIEKILQKLMKIYVKKLGDKNSIRAVASANGKNKLNIVIWM